MSSVTIYFEFEIGDMVYFKDSEHSLGCQPTRFMVILRSTREGPGGTEKLYHLSDWSVSLEIALTREMPSYVAFRNEDVASRARDTERLDGAAR